MSKGYLIAHLKEHDQEGMEKFKQMSGPTIVCGPGSIDQAHKPNEFISIEQINSCSKFLDNLIDNH